MSELADLVVRRGEGDPIRDADGRKAVVLAEREEITITYFRLQPGDRGPSPHVHHRHADAFYVLAGELGFVLGPELERVDVAAGGLAVAPPNLVHTFTNESGAEARFLNFHTPDSGFAAYMRALGDGDGGVGWDSFDPPDDGGLALSEAIVCGPGEGERLVSANRVARLMGVLPSLCFAEFEIDGPFEGPELHHHEAEVDSFYVLEGELEVSVEDERHSAGPGTLASVPRGVRHTFSHPGGGTARFLNIHAPDGGFGAFLRRVSD